MADETFLDRVNGHLPIAHKVCRLYFDDKDDRDDAMQEMMYQLWRSYPNFRGDSKFSTWMYSVCLKTALTYKRNSKKAKKKNESLSPDHHEIPDIGGSDKEGAIALLFQAISKLQAVNRAIILLYLEDLSYEEIAAITGLTKTNVSVRLVRIKKVLETELRKLNSIEDVNF